MRFRRGIAFGALAGAVMTATPVVAVVTSTPAAAASKPEVVASGLDGPEKLTFGPDGKLYVAEAGTGGQPNADHSNCAPNPEGEGEACYGETGRVTKIDVSTGDPTHVITGLGSISSGDEGSSGPVDVAVADDGTIYVLNSLGVDPNFRDQLGAPFTNLGTIFKQGPSDTAPSQFADIGAFERDNDPDKDEPRDPSDPSPTTDSNPYAMVMKSDGTLLVADAGGNDVLGVDAQGAVTLVSALPFRMVDPPPFIVCQEGQTQDCVPPGQQIPMQPVPTAVELVPSQVPAPIGSDTIYIGQLTGFPFPVRGSNIYTVNSNADPHDNLDVAFEGLTNVIDVAIGADGTVYALEIASEGLLAGTPENPFSPALIEIRPDGTQKVLLNGQDLSAPGGVAVGSDGMLYVTNCALCGPGAGSVIKVDPTVARDPATASACDPATVTGTNFEDITQDFHHEAIECVNFWGVMQGEAESIFGPRLEVTRGEAATIVARIMEAAGYTLPDNPPNKFPDDDNSVHAHRIDQLAEIGVIQGLPDGKFHPDDPVNRGQIASLFVRAYNKISGGTISGTDAFGDDTNSGHEADINAAAAKQWVNGVGGGNFNPFGAALRDQIASIAARVLSTLVDDGKATPPGSGGGVPTP